MTFQSQEVRDLFHRLVPTKVQHDLARLELATLIPDGQTLHIEGIDESQIILKITDQVILPALSVEE